MSGFFADHPFGILSATAADRSGGQTTVKVIEIGVDSSHSSWQPAF
jgi:hypothetical protein